MASGEANRMAARKAAEKAIHKVDELAPDKAA
jgi:hypothetical protein